MRTPRGISSAAPVRIALLTLAALGTGWIMACSGGGGADAGPSSPGPDDEVASIQIEPSQVVLTSVGETAQLVATARTASGSTASGVTFLWSSSNASVATVSATGLVAARGRGTATVMARAEGAEGVASVAVNLEVASVRITPSSTVLEALDATVQLQAEARTSSGDAIPGLAATWSSSAAGVASVNASGLVTAEGNGSATVTATIEGVSGTATIDVSQTVTGVRVIPTSASTTVGGQIQFEAEAEDANGFQIAGAIFAWSSSDVAVATVDASGLATGVGEGMTIISGATDGVTAEATLTVTRAVASVDVTPATAQLAALGATAQFSAEARDGAGDVIDDVAFTWTSSDEAAATVDASGLATATGNGQTTITATADGVSGSATLTVDQVVTAVRVTPATASTTVGETVQFSASAVDANDSAVSGAAFTWSSSDEAVATVDVSGLATAVTVGQATITATSEGVEGSATLTVSEGSSGSMRMVSGNDQNGTTQLEFPQPLVVEVQDGDGNAEAGVTVTWEVIQGDATVSLTSVQTDAQGRASVTLTAGQALTEHRIQASADDRDGSPIVFDARTTVLQVFIEDDAFVDLAGRTNRDFSVSVAVGDTIEWLYRESEASVHTVTSSSEPQGGASFDSGNLAPGDTFRFVPGVAGTWEYFCEIHPSIMLEAEIVVS